MNNSIKNIPPLTKEQVDEIKALEGRKIDYSDIPPLTEDEIKRFRENIRRKKSLKNIAS